MPDARIHIAAVLLATFALSPAYPMTSMQQASGISAHAMIPKRQAAARPAKPAPHRLVIQVNQNDPAVMNLALNNATNAIEYYRAKNEDVDVDIVTYGPGLHMLRADTSPVQDRLKRLKEMAFPGKIQFSACNNSKQGVEKTEGSRSCRTPPSYHQAWFA